MCCRALTRSSFETAMLAAPTGMLAVDTSAIIITANEVAAQVSGYQIADLAGQHLNVLLPRQYHSHHEKLFAKFVASPERRPMGMGRDFEIVHKSGRLVPVEIGLEPCLIDGTFTILATVVDITGRKTAERYRAEFSRTCGKVEAFESVGLAAALVDSNGTILAPNRHFEQTKDLVVNGVAAVVQRRFLKTLKSALESGKPHGLRINTADDHGPTVALVIPVRSETTQPEASLALMVIHSSSRIEPIESDLLKEVFEFTPAEANVAAALARGMRVTEIASQLNVSRETIRTELSHVFSKTGLSSQIELVMLLAPFVKQ
jgi:PAS domain S-box-containing protein